MIRYALALLMLVCTAAYGQSTEWVARAKNNSGGLIVLLSIKGQCTHGRRMYSANTEGRSHWGCWFPTDNHIIVNWDTLPQVTTYDYTGWELNPANEAGRNRGLPGTF